MPENSTRKHFYYVQIADEFLNSRQIQRLERQENGHSLVLLLIHLLSDTKNTDGVLVDDMGTEWAAMDAETISADHPSFSIDFVKNALQRYLNMGLMVKRDDGYLAFADYQSCTKTYNARKQKRSRDKQKNKNNGNDVTNDVNNNGGNGVTNNKTIYHNPKIHNQNPKPAESSSSSDDSALDDDSAAISDAEFDELTQGLTEYDKIDLRGRITQYNPRNPRAYIRACVDYALQQKSQNPALNYEQRPTENYGDHCFLDLNEVARNYNIK